MPTYESATEDASRMQAAAERWLATDPAREAHGTLLPGRVDGPADAYRHLLWSGELTRRFGEPTARAILYAHEKTDDLSGYFCHDCQSKASEQMDFFNNGIGIGIGRAAKTWDDVVAGAHRIDGRSDGTGSAGCDGCPKMFGSHQATRGQTGRPFP